MSSVWETCDECAFDGGRWTDSDVLTTMPILGVLWDGYVAGAPDSVVEHRPEPECWSIAEYTDHVREVLFAMRFLAGIALNEPDRDLGSSPKPKFDAEPRTIDMAAAVAAIGAEGRQLAGELAEIDSTRWAAGVTIDDQRVDLRWIARHGVHDSLHHLYDVGRIRARLGDGVPPQNGTVTGLHVSTGGVPKHAVERAVVGWSGMSGDAQNDRRHHGRPFQALCLWSAEVIEALQAEGHPIGPGSAGENVTVAGIDWSTLRPGAIVRIGDVVGEITSYAIPCHKNAQWFADGEFRRILHDRHPGWSRLYARVLRHGSVQVGDVVEVEPDGSG
jgi:MOSC domain-containing protein YiiM